MNVKRERQKLEGGLFILFYFIFIDFLYVVDQVKVSSESENE